MMRYLSILTAAIAIFTLAAGQFAQAKGQAEPPIVSKCRADLAKRLKVKAETIKLVEAEPTVWPNAALGMPEIAKVYAEVLTPGHRVVLAKDGEHYLYTASSKTFKYGGPVSAWSHSLLFIRPNPKDANLNGDLYQCSLLGTNPVRLLSEVSDSYPQTNGIIIAKRRTSRSFHDLLYIKASEPSKAVTLQTAVDFGDVAVNEPGSQWAGFVRPALGSGWVVLVAPLAAKGSEPISLPLSDGLRPDRIAWEGETVVVLVRKDDQTLCYQASPNAAAPEWKQVGMHIFPNLPPYMLNKSQTLVIEQAKDGGKTAVEVAKVWFTGDRDVVATVPGLTLRGFDLLGGSAIVWGENNGQPAVYAVQIHTGEIIQAHPGVPQEVKPFSFAPRETPLGTK